MALQAFVIVLYLITATIASEISTDASQISTEIIKCSGYNSSDEFQFAANKNLSITCSTLGEIPVWVKQWNIRWKKDRNIICEASNSDYKFGALSACKMKSKPKKSYTISFMYAIEERKRKLHTNIAISVKGHSNYEMTGTFDLECEIVIHKAIGRKKMNIRFKTTDIIITTTPLPRTTTTLESKRDTVTNATTIETETTKATKEPLTKMTTTVHATVSTKKAPTTKASMVEINGLSTAVWQLKENAMKLNATALASMLNQTSSGYITSNDISELSNIVNKVARKLPSSANGTLPPKQKEIVLKNLVGFTSNILSKNDSWSGMRNEKSRLDSVSSFTASLEEIAMKISVEGEFLEKVVEVSSPHVNLTLAPINTNKQKVDVETIGSHTISFALKNTESLKQNGVNQTQSPCILLLNYKGVSHLFSNSNGTQSKDGKTMILTDIIGASISDRKYFHRLQFRMRLNQMTTPASKGGRLRCGYWNDSMSAWYYNGCQILNQSDTFATCECDHMTNFAVLMDFTGLTQSHHEIHKYILSVISLSGCFLSLVMCLFAGIGYEFTRRYTSRQPRRESKMTNIIYELIFFSNAAVDLTFIVGINLTQSKVVCGIMAGLLHYFLLLQYEWMTVAGIFYVIIFRKAYHLQILESNYRWILLALSALPAFIVGISATIQPDDYGSDKICWLANTLIWAFIGPISVILGFNFIVLIILIYLTEKENISANEKLVDTDANRSWIMSRKVKYKYELIFVFGLGITWLLGYPSFEMYSSLISSYLFSICNSFQGFIICLICASWDRITDGYLKFLLKHEKILNWFFPCLKERVYRRNSRLSFTVKPTHSDTVKYSRTSTA